MIRIAVNALVALACLALAPAARAQTPVAELAQAPASAETWSIASSAARHGQSQRWTAPDGARWSRESLLLRGFVTEIDQQIRFAPDGSMQAITIRGVVPEGDAGESYSAADGRFTYRSPVDHGDGAVAPGRLYSSFGGTLDSTIVVLDALMRAPNHTIDLLPSGRASLERLADLQVSNGSQSKTLTAYAVIGYGFSPFPVWFEGDRFFGIASTLSYMPVGWEAVTNQLSEAQDAALARRSAELVSRLGPRPTAPIVFQNVRLFDSEARAFRDAMSVVVSDGRISAVGPTASTQAPAGAQLIDGAGRTLIPGLWDSHQHYGDDSTGLLLLSQGITSVRDPGNRQAELQARKRRIDAGELLGTRIVPSLLIDGEGPNAAQSGVIVRNRAEAIAAVRRAKREGYFGVKLYGTLNPALVRPIATEAHRLGLRVHGHVPAGMRPIEAARAGYDELTHINFVMMQAMPDDVVRQSNGLQRFFGPGRYAADVDLNSPAMQAYLDELARRHIAVDPTLATFETTFVPERGEIAPAYAPLAGTLPPQVERAFHAGGLSPPADLPRAQMRRSFEKLRGLVAELHRRGVTIVAGTDDYGIVLVRELELYVSAGLSPAEALATATITPSRLYGVGDETGSIAVGKKAELALINGDPSRNIGDLRQVELVMRDGRLMRASDLRAAIGLSGPPRAALSSP